MPGVGVGGLQRSRDGVSTNLANYHAIKTDLSRRDLPPLAPPRPHPTLSYRPLFFDSNGGARLVLARMRRYSASLLVQESGFHQLVAEFNKGRGIPRASLAQEVAIAVAGAMASFSQVCLTGHAARAVRCCCRLGGYF